MPCHEAADHCRLACLKLLIPKDNVNVKGKVGNCFFSTDTALCIKCNTSLERSL